MADAGELKARATLDNAEFMGALGKMVDGIQKSSEESAAQFEKITGAIGNMMSAAAGIGALGGLAAFAQDLVDTALKTDKLEAAFKALNGATEETHAVFEDIKGLELHSMFDFEDTLGPAAKNMMMLGVSADQTSKTMQAVVDAAAALKQGPDWINQVTEAVGKMQSHMVASSRDMKALQQSGIDAYGALAKEIGTSVPEAIEKIKKGQVESQTVTEAVTKYMEDRFKGAAENSMGSWRGAMHLLSESSEDAKEAVGRSITSLLNTLAPILKGVADAIKDMADWWTNLSEPVKQAVMIITAAITAVTALSAALPALEAGLALIGGEMTLATGGIAAVVAALALLAKWVYDNWPAVKAVFTEVGTYLGQTFSGITAAVQGAWDWIKKTFGTLGEWIGSALNGLMTAVGKAVGWISDVLGKAPGGIGAEWQKLGQIWNKAQTDMANIAEAQKAQKKAMEDSATAATKEANASRQAEAAALARENAAKQAAQEAAKRAAEREKQAREDTKLVNELWKVTDQAEESGKKLGETLTKAYYSIEQSATKIVPITKTLREQLPDVVNKFLDVQAAFHALGLQSQSDLDQTARNAQQNYETIRNSGVSSAEDIERAWKAYQQTVEDADLKTRAINDAFHDLGVKSADELQKLSDKAQEDFDTISANADANSLAVQQAWVNKTKIAYDQITQAGGQLTDDQKAQLDRMQTNIDEHLTPLPSRWKTTYDGVKSAVSGAFDDMISKLMSGDGNFKDTMMTMLTDIGNTALHAFIDPFKDAVAKFVAHELADLIGGKGLGGVFDGLKNIGGMIGGIFGKGGGGGAVGGVLGDTGGANPLGGIFGQAGSAGGAAGGAGGMAGGFAGIMNPIGAVGSVVGAVSGIIGNFQNARQETTLNAIEHNTRYTMMYVGERADGGILGVLFKIDEELAWGANTKATEKLKDLFHDYYGDIIPILNDIKVTGWNLGPYITDIKTSVQDIGSYMGDIKTALQGDGGGRTININISPQGLTTAEAAKALGDQIATNLTGQLAGA